MTLPIDLVLVRHGQSEGNLARQYSLNGKPEVYDQIREGRHTKSFRLTDLGRQQATRAGAWLQTEFKNFDRHFVSEFIRAVETAALLGLPNAKWRTDYALAERNWGDFDNVSEGEREEHFSRALEMRDIEPFFWTPPNGESFQDICLRLEPVMERLHRKCSDKRVVIVCHSQIMWAFRVILERMSQKTFGELYRSRNPQDRLANCQILHYSRRDPVSQRVESNVNWLRMIRPAEASVLDSKWKQIQRQMFTNEELLALAEKHPAVLLK